MNVLITDDSALIRKKLSKKLEKIDFIDLIYNSSNGEETVKALANNKVDAIILDINMPGIDGITTMQMVEQKYKIPCIIYSSFTEKNKALTYEALELGAYDIVHKPHGVGAYSFDDSIVQLTSTLKNIKYGKNKGQSGAVSNLRGLILIGMSTGGPKSIRQIVPEIEKLTYHAIVIIQHMPQDFIPSFAQRMNSYSKMPCLMAEHNEVVRPGNIYLAPGGKNLHFLQRNGDLIFSVQRPDKNQFCIPLIDRSFISASEIMGRNLLSIVLTGMGSDGAQGAKVIKENGGLVFIESEETSIIYGMPRETKRLVNIDGEVDNHNMAKIINEYACEVKMVS